VRRGINTALGIVVAITLYLPIAGAAGGESKAKKTPSPASAVHLSKTRTAQAKADRKPKAKVVSEKKKTHQNKTANGQQVKPFVLPVEKSEGTPVPIGERVAEWSVVDRGDAKRAANSSGDKSAEVQNVHFGEEAAKNEIYATVIKTQQIYIPQRPGCDAMQNYRQFRLSDADDWRRLACLRVPESASLEPNE
jgi:hypothetical protein